MSTCFDAKIDKNDMRMFHGFFVPPGEGGGYWVRFCWVCAAGLSEPPHHYSLFCSQL